MSAAEVASARVLPDWRGGRVLVMGILNCTPDSFSDGANVTTQARIDHALRLVEEGADILDLGGESTRPGAELISADEELRRVLPVLKGIRKTCNAPVSIDTNKVAVAQAALAEGADIINDITALRGEGDMAAVAARSGAPVILMHMRGLPRDMQVAPQYADVCAEVTDFLLERAAFALSHGVAADRIILDPGFGFGKDFAHNTALFRSLGRLCAAGYPVLVGVSRKSMIGQALHLPVGERLAGSLALAVLAAERGAAVVRVHDVKETVQALRMREAVLQEQKIEARS